MSKLTFLVFKDNLAARTFQIPLGWLTRVGLYLSASLVIVVGSVAVGIHGYRLAQQAGPERVRELERELAELKASLEPKPIAQQQQAPAEPASTAAAPSQPADSPAQAPATQNAASTRFAHLPLVRSTQPPVRESLPISIDEPRVVWAGKTLKVRFNIQYTKGDGGNQQGRIVIVARGPRAVLAYPDGALMGSRSDSIVDHEKGEYFSISRFRAVEADFGPLEYTAPLQEVEAMLLGLDGNILITQKLEVPKYGGKTTNEKKETHGPAF